MPNPRQSIFPYGMSRNSDGTWTFFNRDYKPVGVVTNDWAEWDDPKHKLAIKGLGPATLRKLSYDGQDREGRIYFYDDGSNPELSPANLTAYLNKLKILLGLQEDTKID
jgi:hypothetical protein